MPPRPRILRPPAFPTPRRRLASSSRTPPPAPTSPPPPPPPRWLAELPARVGRCLAFGCSAPQTARAAAVLGAVAAEWRPLVAGADGFLTGGRRGLEGQRVVWGEMDVFGHVNNVTYARYAESSRVNWINYFGIEVDPARRREWAELMTPRSTGLILKSLKVDFKFPMTYPDTISVYHKLREAPEGAPTSVVLDCIILSHRYRRAAARTVEDIVVYDYRKGAKTEMPVFMRDVLAETWQLQLREAIRARARIWELINAVENLEKETWDRDDAVEDLGSAANKG